MCKTTGTTIQSDRPLPRPAPQTSAATQTLPAVDRCSSRGDGRPRVVDDDIYLLTSLNGDLSLRFECLCTFLLNNCSK